MRERMLCRFKTKEDFDSFVAVHGYNITKFTKEYNIHTGESKNKKSVTPRKPSEEYWKSEWFDMPEYVSVKQEVYAKIEFIFNEEDLEMAKEIFQQKMTEKTKSVWFPESIKGLASGKRAVGGDLDNKYPIYVVSKGRHDKCTTSRFLTQMEVAHYIVVEPQEVAIYRESIKNDYAEILELDMSFKDNYNTFDDLGDSKPKGPGGARNFAWEHSVKNGFTKHWVMDDNAVDGFYYMFHNQKIKARTGSIFRACEDFMDRYSNLAISGLNYRFFCDASAKTPAFVMNTRIYSFLLIDNSINHRWRGRYNEDTDLSLNVLKDGLCTVQFNAFLAGKAATQTVSGGNTDEFYSKEGTYPKSKMLEDMHPDIAKVVWKFKRWHHYVDYNGFTQKLILKDGYVRSNKDNNYGIQIIDVDAEDKAISTDSRSYLEVKYNLVAKDVPKVEAETKTEVKKDLDPKIFDLIF